MFETVAPALQERRSRRRRMAETLPLSIAVHGVVAAAVFATAMFRVSFPQQPPAVMRSFMIAGAPPPPPPPPPPPAPKRAVSTPKIEVPKETFAPTVVPDQIIPVADIPPPQEDEGDSSGENGVEGGVPGGVAGGVVGGVVGGLVTKPVVPDDGRLYIDRKTKLPLEVVEQPYPRYPEKLRWQRKEGMVTIRYVIGTNGRVTDVTILDPDPEILFNEATLDAIRRWRFRPFRKDGKPIEVVHELSVIFTLVHR